LTPGACIARITEVFLMYKNKRMLKIFVLLFVKKLYPLTTYFLINHTEHQIYHFSTYTSFLIPVQTDSGDSHNTHVIVECATHNV
jgi:hypothetical protein